MTSRKKASQREEREGPPCIFTRLRDLSAKCLQTTISYVHEDQEEMHDSITPISSCGQIIDLRNQIKQQLTDMKTDLQIRGLSKDMADGPLNISLTMAFQPLETEMCSMKNKEIAIARSILAVISHTVDICKMIQAVQSFCVLLQSNRILEEKLASVRKSRMEVRLLQQELFKKVKITEERKNKLQEIEMKTQVVGKENMDTVANKVIIIQEIFQRCILSTHTDWSEDPHLTRLLLKMKDSPFQ
ncbi:centromere protein H isoform X4 [Xenopus tropicalis]|uniref:Centromere protein H isoform X4 n=1 Tax=Xenopus tropicalis TaxID=8364 RepID=A0A8J0SPP3_XENTR|nr:centromere protein H isoform X4 [Xenopus tropicalis]|eukprot:XP_012819275.1 PREDICTED: centromere protein H-like isoform X3 [Xenopus tropicalis]